MPEYPQLRFRLSLQVPAAAVIPLTPASPTSAEFCTNRIGARGRMVLYFRSTLILKGVLNRIIFGYLLRHFLLLLPDLRLMPPRKASTRRSMASVARSERAPHAPTSSPVFQAPPPLTTVVGMEQFDLLVQQVRGLTKAVQVMQQQ